MVPWGAEAGNAEAAHALGKLSLAGAGAVRDPDEAASWFARAAASGDARAQVDLAALLLAGEAPGLAQAPPPVHEWFEQAAARGDRVGAFNYAVCLAEGVGVGRDDARAVHWLKYAAETVVEAQFWYARMLAAGRGVVKNDVEAALWYTRAAEGGVADAQVAIGEMYLNGRGVAQNADRAKSWFMRAAEAGHVGAMFALGVMYVGGYDTETDCTLRIIGSPKRLLTGHPQAAAMAEALGKTVKAGAMAEEKLTRLCRGSCRMMHAFAVQYQVAPTAVPRMTGNSKNVCYRAFLRKA